MWRSLLDPQVVDAFLAEQPAEDDRRVQTLAASIKHLTTLSLPREVFAVTSMGQLWFTSARSYAESTTHPAVVISCRGNECHVAFCEAGHKQSTTESRCSAEELPSKTELFVLRLVRES